MCLRSNHLDVRRFRRRQVSEPISAQGHWAVCKIVHARLNEKELAADRLVELRVQSQWQAGPYPLVQLHHDKYRQRQYQQFQPVCQ